MADIKQKFGTNNQAITCSLASLANSSARQSTEIDNTSDLFVDVLVSLSVKTNAAGTSATGFVAVYLYATVDGGTSRTENAGASDAAITLTSLRNAIPLGVLNTVANATTYYGGPWSVAKAFGGVMPAKWGIIVDNRSGAALDSTEGNHNKRFQGIHLQTV